MQVCEFQASFIDDVVAIYNEWTDYTPYCYPISAEQLHEAVLNKEDFEPEGFFIAFDSSGRPLGFLHCGFLDANKQKAGIFLFIAFHRNACEHLLTKAIDYLKSGGAKVCYTMSDLSGSNRFYAGVHMGYEVALWIGFYEVVAAFRRHGFECIRERFFMNKKISRGDEILTPKVDVDLSVERSEDTGSFYTDDKVIAYANGKKIGGCRYHLLKPLSDHFGKGIGQFTIAVDDDFHGKGVGPALLSQAHKELVDLGAHEVILTTNYQFYPAIRMYERFGYHREQIEAPVFAAYF